MTDTEVLVVVQVTTTVTAAARLTFFQDLVARRPGRVRLVRLVTSDAHAGLVAAIGATLPWANWQRRLTH